MVFVGVLFFLYLHCPRRRSPHFHLCFPLPLRLTRHRHWVHDAWLANLHPYPPQSSPHTTRVSRRGDRWASSATWQFAHADPITTFAYTQSCASDTPLPRRPPVAPMGALERTQARPNHLDTEVVSFPRYRVHLYDHCLRWCQSYAPHSAVVPHGLWFFITYSYSVVQTQDQACCSTETAWAVDYGLRGGIDKTTPWQWPLSYHGHFQQRCFSQS